MLLTTTVGFVEWDGSRLIEHPEIAVALGVRAEGVFHVLQDRTGATWYCTEKGIYRESGGSFQRFLPDPAGGRNGALRAYEDPTGEYVVPDRGGRVSSTLDLLECVAPEVNARAITVDRDGNLWIGTNGAGLVRLKTRTVTTFTKAEGLPNNVVMTVLSATDGKVWVGNNCGGLSWFDDSELDGARFHTYAEKDGLTNSCVTALAEDSNHDLWVGTSGGGLFRFHTGHFQAFTKSGGLASDTVTCVLIARDGSLWIGTIAGLTRLRDGILRTYTTADGLSGKLIMNVFQDRSGVIRVATDSGIDRLDGDRFVAAFRSQDHRVVYLAGESPTGDLYIALAGLGISRMQDGKLMGIASLDGVQRQGVQNDLWVAGGAAGVIRVGAVSLRNWESKQQEPLDYTQFGRADGMLSREIPGGYPNMTVTRDGKLWIATLGGASVLDPPGFAPPPASLSSTSARSMWTRQRNAYHELILPPGLHHTELTGAPSNCRRPKACTCNTGWKGSTQTGWTRRRMERPFIPPFLTYPISSISGRATATASGIVKESLPGSRNSRSSLRPRL